MALGMLISGSDGDKYNDGENNDHNGIHNNDDDHTTYY